VNAGDGAPCFLGVDVGGTFTDVVLGDADGRVVTHKVATTPDDPRRAVASGAEEVLDLAGVDPARITRVVHGTTLATNVVLERRGSPVSFVTTEGFADMVRLGREVRLEDERFDLWFTTPEPPVRHRDTVEVRERVDARGEVVVALDPAVLDAAVTRVVAASPEAVAVCFLNAYANPLHERTVAAALRAALPDAYVVASSEIWPEMREYERAMTTVMCAYVGPVMATYLAGLEARLGALGIRAPVEVMESSGGVMSASLAARRPIYTVESGGAAGVIAAGFVGSRSGISDVVSFDMGGTTAKAGIVRGGRPDIADDFRVGGRASAGGSRAGSGFPVKIPVVDLAEVGAGGGSIAWVDSGGALRVGPRSAGSVPGPACYGRGGDEPTVTDANLLLGYLRPGALSGGVSLDPERSRAALERAVASPLGLGLAEAAHAVHEIANANMAAAIRVVTIQRGIDPRGFTMVGFGGAGPIHAAALARTFAMSRVVVPWAAGVASAVGLITADLVVDRVVTNILAEHELDPAVLTAAFRDLEADAAADLPEEGTPEVTRSVDARYRGQAHQLRVPAPSGELGAEEVDLIVKGFVDEYERSYGIHLDAPVELVNLRVRLVRLVAKPRPSTAASIHTRDAERLDERPVYVASHGGFVSAGVHDWSQLAPGARVVGPAVIEGADTTVVVPPDVVAQIDEWRNVVLGLE
jgi:N-methylhydantoinase A